MSTSDDDRATRTKIEIYDTTLRDGSQLEGISLTVDDKLRIAEQLDWLGVDYIEAGWPGANPKDDEFFRRARDELHLDHSTLVAFGMTRRAKGKVDSDDTLRHLVEAGTGTVCIVGKCWDYHVTEALGTTLDEGVAMVDGLGRVPEGASGSRSSSTPSTSSTGSSATRSSACGCSRARRRRAPTASCCATPTAGACRSTSRTRCARSSTTSATDVRIGVHLHDDTGCGVANALAGVRGGAQQVQGTINGYGERTGNCNLTTIIPNLTLKMGIETLPPDRMERLTPVAHHVAELVNMSLNPQAAVRRLVGVRAQGRVST